MNKENEKIRIKKSATFYVISVLIWSILMVAMWSVYIKFIIDPPFFEHIVPNTAMRIFASVFIFLNGFVISLFWLSGVKDAMYVFWYTFGKKKLMKEYLEVCKVSLEGVNDKVLLVYCTCNDFDSVSLKKSINQDYHNCDVVILDDSYKAEYIDEVNLFAKENNIKVIRRKDRIGFKAGNINNYLLSEEMKGKGYDYAVILDSDEIIPSNFTSDCLKYFYKYENIGIVQANHVATRNRNLFMRLFHIGVNAHWPTYQVMKQKYGFLSMLGHGAMIKRECYEEAGGFPNLVAEDLCLSIEMRKSNYLVAFAPHIICEEEYPIDYVAFKKRHSKWTQGNLEFIKKYTPKIIKSKMRWFEKLDVILFTYNLPVTAFLALAMVINVIALPLLGVNLGNCFGPWIIVLSTIFFLSPVLNDVITWIFKINPFVLAFYVFWSFVLYGSMLYLSLVCIFKSFIGKKAKFIVTPKHSVKMNLWSAIKLHYQELIFSTVMMVVALLVSNTVLPVLLAILTGYLSFFVLFFSNKKYSKEQYEKMDTKSIRLTLKGNWIYNEVKKLEAQNMLKNDSDTVSEIKFENDNNIPVEYNTVNKTIKLNKHRIKSKKVNNN